MFIHSLKSRRLFAALIDTGTLTVAGTSGNDRIRLYIADDKVQVTLNDIEINLSPASIN